MKLTELEAMWKEDCVVNELNLGQEAARIPRLHAKYLGHLMQYKLQLRKAESELSHMKRNKRVWYSGKMSQEDLEKLQWPQYLFSAVLKSDMERVISEDELVIKQIDKIEYLRNTVYAIESIMKSISSRGWDVKTALEFEKFRAGL